MIQLSHPTPDTIRIRCGLGHDIEMPWGPDMDPWRWAYLVSRGVLSTMPRDPNASYGEKRHKHRRKSLVERAGWFKRFWKQQSK